MIGSKLGPYKITAKLGEGGMGEVWRAHDANLGRDVALKVLPEAFTEDAERLARFEREAKLLAQLNHQNIAHIYGLETSGATRALVMELVEGPTLADRLKKGALPVEESLSIARQVAEALEEAHEKGIIHRDLKPANIKASPDGKAKVLDFGLAKAMEATGSSPASASQLAQSPTLTLGATVQGVILGTAAYMAPEQAKGLPVDKRADIWAFGVVLWEVLTGRSLFAGDSVPDTLARVLQREIDFEALPPKTPPAIRRLLRRCLERQPKNRLHDIADARLVIEESLAGRVESAAPPLPTNSRERIFRIVPWALLALTAGGLVVEVEGNRRPRPPLRGQFEISLPPGRQLDAGFRRAVAISPDGRTIAVITSDATRPPAELTDQSRRIELRSLDDSAFRPLAGSEGALELAFSPDGMWIAFSIVPRVSDSTSLSEPYSEIRKVSIQGGRPIILCSNRGGWGLSWSADGWIAFAGPDGPIQKVRAEGGAIEPLTRLTDQANSTQEVLPMALPDGRAWLYSSVATRSYRGQGRYALRSRRNDVANSEELLEGTADVRFVPPDHLLFASEGRIREVRFDLQNLKVTSEAKTLVDGVAQALNTTSSSAETAQAQYDVSGNGVLVYAPGGIAPPNSSEINWIDATGHQSKLDLEPAPYLTERLSPDGGELLFSMIYPGRQVELFDLKRGIGRRVASRGTGEWAIWGPHAGQYTFASDIDGSISLYVGSVDGAVDDVSPLFKTPPSQEIEGPSSWSPDGNRLLYVVSGERSTGDVWLFERGQAPRPFLATPFDEGYPEFSPDGRWVAFGSNQTGVPAVWVRPFSNEGRASQVSLGWAVEPAWSRDGKYIYYETVEPVSASSRLQNVFVRVRVAPEGTGLAMGKPERLFAGDFGHAGPIRHYDLAPDGRILLHLQRKLDDTERGRRTELLFPKKLIVILGHLGNEAQ